MRIKWLMTGLLAGAAFLTAAETADAQVRFGRSYNYNPYSAMPPGFYQGFYYGIPGTPFVRFRGIYSGPGGIGFPVQNPGRYFDAPNFRDFNTPVPGGRDVEINQTFRDSPVGSASRAGGYGDDGAMAGYGLMSPTTRAYGARVGAGYAAPRAGAALRRDGRELRAELEENQVHIRVILPSEDAKLWFEDTLSEQQGAERVFMTPGLERGTTYTAKLTAAWKENGKEIKREKKVDVRVGREVTVDFTEPEAAEAQAKPVKDLPPE